MRICDRCTMAKTKQAHGRRRELPPTMQLPELGSRYATEYSTLSRTLASPLGGLSATFRAVLVSRAEMCVVYRWMMVASETYETADPTTDQRRNGASHGRATSLVSLPYYS